MLQYRAFRLMQCVVERLRRPHAYALAIVVARFAYVFARRARERLEVNLRMVLPEAPPAEIRRLAWLNFRNHAKAYADLMQMPRAQVDEIRPLLHVEGKEHLDAALAHGKGVFVVSVHMGSWEIAAAIWSATMAPVSYFAEVLEPRELYDWYRTTRARLGISVLPLGSAGLRHVVDALRANEVVITALDRDILGTGIWIPFFGRPAPIPTGPAALALRYGTPLLPVAAYRRPDDNYVAVALPHLHAHATGDREADERRVTTELLGQLETFIRLHPEQWHVPHVIWEEPPALVGPRPPVLLGPRSAPDAAASALPGASAETSRDGSSVS